MHKLTVFAVTALLCLALLAGAAPVAAQSSTDVRILREARDSYNNEWIEFRCPDGSGGWADKWPDFNRNGRRDCADFVPQTILVSGMNLIQHGYRTWSRPASSPTHTHVRTVMLTATPDIRMSLYRSPTMCSVLLLRAGDDAREYRAGDAFNGRHDSRAIGRRASAEVVEFMNANRAGCNKTALLAWGAAGALVSSALGELRIVQGRNDVMGSTYGAPVWSISGDVFHPFVTNVSRGVPQRLSDTSMRSPWLWVWPRTQALGLNAFAADLAAMIASTSPSPEPAYIAQSEANATRLSEQGQAAMARGDLTAAAAAFSASIENFITFRSSQPADMQPFAATWNEPIQKAFIGAVHARTKLAAAQPNRPELFEAAVLAAENQRGRLLADSVAGGTRLVRGGVLTTTDIREFIATTPRGVVYISVTPLEGDGVAVLAFSRDKRIAFIAPMMFIEERMAPVSIIEDLANPNSDLSTSNHHFERLNAALIGPLADIMKDAKRLSFTMDGRFARIPPGLLGQPGDARRLAELYEVEVAPSYRLRMSRGLFVGNATGLLAFGDPIYPATFTTTNFNAQPVARTRTEMRRESAGRSIAPRPVRNGSALAVPMLPDTRVEVETIAALFPAASRRIALGREATASSFFSQNLKAYRYIHLATHGVLGGAIPGVTDPALIMAMEPRGNALIRAGDLRPYTIDGATTVLSACSTGDGGDAPGEGLETLARAFLLAGSNAVVASHWPVDSQTTTELMTAFYRHDTRLNDPAKSLQLAMAEIRARKPHPFYWAPFTASIR